MPLTITIVSEHRDLVGRDCEREYYEEGGTIGRSLQNDWILPDPDRFISGRHATIDYKGGMYYLADTSTNGVYINGEIEPIGNSNPRRLFDGDRLRMGDFEFEVRIDKGESLVMPLEPKPSVAPDNIEQFVEEDVIETGIPLLDEAEITGGDQFQSLLFGGKPEGEKEKKLPNPAPEPEARMESANDGSASKQSERAEVTADDLFDSFLDGLGISRDELHPPVNSAKIMLTAGIVLREFVEGTISLLASRATLKKAFRLDQTAVLPQHNNPMKFSDNTNDLIKQLLVGQKGEYLDARDAVREANRDLVNHQNAFLDAISSAFVEFADRFDPEELQDEFDRSMKTKLFRFLNKAKYWDLYCDLYPIMTEKGGGKFPQIFGDEFVKAHEREVSRLRCHDRDGTAKPASRRWPSEQVADPGLLQTQKLDGPRIAKSKDSDQAFEERVIVDQLEDSPAEEIRRDHLGG